jgi:acetyl esterase/lipase
MTGWCGNWPFARTRRWSSSSIRGRRRCSTRRRSGSVARRWSGWSRTARRTGSTRRGSRWPAIRRAAALAILSPRRLKGQLLYYPALDTSFDSPSYDQFATGYWLRRDVMRWFWDQYAPAAADRAQATAAPLRATIAELTGLPPALVVVGEADVLRDEGEAYARNLRRAGVAVTGVRYQGAIHDFVMLDALRETRAARAAVAQGGSFLREVLH